MGSFSPLSDSKAQCLLETTSKHEAAPSSLGMQKTQYDIAVEQFQRAADLMKLDENVQEILRKPRRILSINFPVKDSEASITTRWDLTRVESDTTRTLPSKR